MADRIKGITIEIGGDTTGLSKALSGVNRDIKDTQSQLKDVNSLLKMDPTSTELISQKFKLLKQSISETEDKLSQLKSVQSQMDDGLKNGSVTQEQYDAWQREIVATESELKNLETQLKHTDTTVQATLKSAGSKVQDVGRSISSAGDSLTRGITVPVVAAGAASMAAWTEVDEAMDTVAIKTGATGDALGDMQQSAEDLATSIPTDFGTAADAVGEVHTRFKLTGDALEGLSGQFVKFADLNKTDVSTSVDGVSKVLAAFNMDSKDAGGMLDVFNAVGQSTGISMDTLSESLSSNAAALQDMGLNATQSAQFLGQTSMAGMDTGAAMTGLKTAMTNAAKEGMTASEALSKWQGTMSSSGSETDKLNATVALFGAKSGQAFYNAANSGKLHLSGLKASMSDYSGSVTNTFKGTLDPIDKFKTTLNQLKLVGADLGTSIGGALAPVLSQVAEKIKSIKASWDALSPHTQQMIVKAVLIAAAIGPVLSVVGKITTGVGGLIKVVGALASPVGLVIAIIGALVAVFVLLYQHSEAFRQECHQLVETIKAKFAELQPTFDKLKTAFAGLMTALKPIIAFIITLVSGLVQGCIDALGPFVNMISGVIDFISNIINAFGALLRGDFSGFFSYIGAALGAAFEAIKSAITGTFNIINGITSAFGLNLKTVFSTIWEAIVTVVKGAVNGIKAAISAIGTVISVVSGVLHSIASVFSSVLGGVCDVVKGIFEAIHDHIVQPVQKAFSTISEVISKIRGLFNFDWKFPDLKLPHFKIDGSFSLSPPKVPHLAVDWYAQGAVLTAPTIFGTNGNALMAGGEAGPEAVAPIDVLQGYVRAAVADAMGGGFNQTINITSPTALTPSEVARQTRNATRSMVSRLKGGI